MRAARFALYMQFRHSHGWMDVCVRRTLTVPRLLLPSPCRLAPPGRAGPRCTAPAHTRSPACMRPCDRACMHGLEGMKRATRCQASACIRAPRIRPLSLAWCCSAARRPASCSAPVAVAGSAELPHPLSRVHVEASQPMGLCGEMVCSALSVRMGRAVWMHARTHACMRPVEHAAPVVNGRTLAQATAAAADAGAPCCCAACARLPAAGAGKVRRARHGVRVRTLTLSPGLAFLLRVSATV